MDIYILDFGNLGTNVANGSIRILTLDITSRIYIPILVMWVPMLQMDRSEHWHIESPIGRQHFPFRRKMTLFLFRCATVEPSLGSIHPTTNELNAKWTEREWVLCTQCTIQQLETHFGPVCRNKHIWDYSLSSVYHFFNVTFSVWSLFPVPRVGWVGHWKRGLVVAWRFWYMEMVDMGITQI